MNPGKRDKRIIFQRSTTAPDEFNEPIETWSDLEPRWAAVFYGKGEERREAATKAGKQSATFAVPADSMTRSVTIQDRIVFSNDTWDIVGISPLDRSEIEFTAVRSS